MNLDPQNPYAPPLTPISEQKTSRNLGSYQDASKTKRFLNLLVDQVVIMGVSFASAFVVVFTAEIATGNSAEIVSFLDGPGSYLLGYLLTVFYYLLMEAAFGLTLGKLITGTRVADYWGKKPSFGAITGRSFARIVPFEAFSFLGNDSGWHDKWSKTRVVDIRSSPIPVAGAGGVVIRSY